MTQLGATRRRRDVQLTVGRSIEGNQPVRGETWQPSQLKLINHEIGEKRRGQQEEARATFGGLGRNDTALLKRNNSA